MAAIGLQTAATIGPLLVAYQPEIFAPIDIIQLDGTLAESDNLSVDWTDHPIENGQSVQDFGIIQPEQFSLTVMISGTPWAPTVAEALSPTRVEDIPERLKNIARNRYLCSIQTRRGIFDDYAITSLVVTPGDGTHSTEVQLGLKKVRLVASATVALPPLRIDPGASNIATPPVDAGTAATSTTPGSSAAGGAPVPQSTAAASFDTIAGVFGG